MSDRSVPYRHVLVGSDGSRTAGRAVAAASQVAAALGVPLVAVTAWQRHQPDPPARSEEARYPGGSAAGMDAQWAIETTSEAAGVARSHGVTEIRQIQEIGGPAEALLEVSERYPDGLLVVGTYGLTQRRERLLGNVPHQLTHHAQLDLLLCTPRDGVGWSSAALATDGSRTAAVAVERGLEVAHHLGATPTLLTVARSQRRGEAVLADAVGRTPALDGIERRVAVGDEVSRTLRDAATDHGLLVLGNKGMSGPSRLLGSVANRVTHEVPTDLLLVNTTR